MKRIILLIIGIFIAVYGCHDDIFTPEESTHAETMHEPLTVPAGSSNVYLHGRNVQSIEIETDNVWAATDSFLVKLDKPNNTLTYYPYPYVVKDMQCLLESDKNGGVWIVLPTNNGKSNTYRFDENSWDRIVLNEIAPIHSFAIDKDNVPWATADDFVSLFINAVTHLYRLEQGSWLQCTRENSGFYYDYTGIVTSDGEGNIWTANYGNLNIEDLFTFTADLALMKYDGNQWVSYPSESKSFCSAICIDSQGNPWVQRYSALQKLDVTSNSWQEQINLDVDFPLLLNAIEDENRFWFANSNSGIAIYNSLDWTFYTMSNSELPSNKVNQIKIDSDGKKWIATDKGLARF